MAMPWSRAKQVAKALRGKAEFPEGYRGSRTIAELTALFDACFRIQREAIEAAGHFIPLVVENVRGAEQWVGRARWAWGSFLLWGDVPALMPMTKRGERKTPVGSWDPTRANYSNATSRKGQNLDGRKVPGINLSAIGFNVAAAQEHRKTVGLRNRRDGHAHTQHLTNQSERVPRKERADYPYSPGDSRKAASAMIARIPFALSSWIAKVYYPR